MTSKTITVAGLAGHTTLEGYDQGASKYVIEGIANRQQLIGFSKEIEKYPQFKMLVEPEGLALDGEIAWVNKVKPDIAIAFHNNSFNGRSDYWMALSSVTGSTMTFAQIAEKRFKAMGWQSAGIVQKKLNNGQDWYAFLRNTHYPAIIFETAFVDNRTSANKIDTAEENYAIGREYAYALLEYYGIKKSSASTSPTTKPPSISTKPTKVKEDKLWGRDTSRLTQIVFNVAVVDGEIWGQYRPNLKYLPNATTGWQWGYRAEGSPTIVAIQILVKQKQDGVMGPKTIMAIQILLRDLGFYAGKIDGIMGALTVLGWQKYVNSRI